MADPRPKDLLEYPSTTTVASVDRINLSEFLGG